MRFAIILALLVPWQHSPPETGSIAGTVVDSGDGHSLSKAVILIVPVAGSEASRSIIAASDGNGRFSFTGIVPGDYRIKADRNGYLTTQYLAHQQLESGGVVRLTGGGVITGIRVELTRESVLAGTVRDADGEPLEAVRVFLGRTTYKLGKKGAFRVANAITDDRGEYRFGGLTAGRYYIEAEPRPDQQDSSANQPRRECDQPTIYPGVKDISLATAVEVSRAAGMYGIDISMLRSRTFHVKGRISNLHVPGSVQVALFNIGAVGLWDGGISAQTEGLDHDFEFKNVPAGSYSVEMSVGQLIGSALVTVSDSDVEGVSVTLGSAAEVNFKITSAGEPPPKVPDMIFGMSSERRAVFPMHRADGRFMIQDVYPGVYRLFMNGHMPSGIYLKSLRAGPADVFTDGVRIYGNETIDLDVIVASDVGAVAGTVYDRDGRIIPGAVVVLIPDQRQRIDFFLHGTTDQNGRYEFSSAAPGSYKIFAFDNIETDAWTDPSFMRSREDQGDKVTIEPKGRMNLDIHSLSGDPQ